MKTLIKTNLTILCVLLNFINSIAQTNETIQTNYSCGT